MEDKSSTLIHPQLANDSCEVQLSIGDLLGQIWLQTSAHRSTLQTTTQLGPKVRMVHSLEAVFRQLGSTHMWTRSPEQEEREIWGSPSSTFVE